MKKFYMTIVAMLCGAAAMAQTCTLSADPVTAVAGEETTFTIYLNEEPAGTLVQCILVSFDLPDGFTVGDPDEIECPIAPEKKVGGVSYKHALDFFQSAKDPHHYTFSATHASNFFNPNEDPRIFAIIPIEVDASVAGGEYEITNIQSDFSCNGAAVYPQAPFSVKITVGGTGINSINADDTKAPIYNVAGQRVSKAQKGVYIQNGKKIAVK